MIKLHQQCYSSEHSDARVQVLAMRVLMLWILLVLMLWILLVLVLVLVPIPLVVVLVLAMLVPILLVLMPEAGAGSVGADSDSAGADPAGIGANSAGAGKMAYKGSLVTLPVLFKEIRDFQLGQALELSIGYSACYSGRFKELTTNTPASFLQLFAEFCLPPDVRRCLSLLQTSRLKGAVLLSRLHWACSPSKFAWLWSTETCIFRHHLSQPKPCLTLVIVLLMVQTTDDDDDISTECIVSADVDKWCVLQEILLMLRQVLSIMLVLVLVLESKAGTGSEAVAGDSVADAVTENKCGKWPLNKWSSP